VSHADAQLSAARAAIAAVCLDALPEATLGTVQLRDDQRRIVSRAQRAIDARGGCLIAEEVGRGKTYVALALARRWQRPLVVAPASLRTTWNGAAQRAGVQCAILSHESLSRGRMPQPTFDGIIVDESHHFRTSTTRRYSVLADLAARAAIVMLSATPLQNRSRDLAAQLALYLGEMAFALDLPALSRFVIRGDDASDPIMPIVSTPEWVELDADDGRVLRAILDLTPPARPLDAGDAGALRTIGLVRAWASSRAALEATLRTRRRLAAAIEQGVDVGRAPTRREARAWHGVDGAVQLGFASLLMDRTPSHLELAELRTALDCERASMRDLFAVLRTTADPDPSRLCALRHIRAQHPTERIIAFSEFASTISSFFAVMRDDPGIGMLTAREARIASGRLARDELLVRFAPRAQHARPVAAHEAVTLLLTTDLLSEGVNLQDASVVVHLDLPWNPARLAQRIGRVRRQGGAREVRSYLLAPPATAAALLNAEARLRRKLASAESVVGAGFHILPALRSGSTDTCHEATHQLGDRAFSAAAEGALLQRFARWLNEGVAHPSPESPCSIAAVECESFAWLAALDDGRLLCSLGGFVTDAMSSVTRVAELAEGTARDVEASEAKVVLDHVRSWREAECLAFTCGLDAPHGPLRHRVLRWLSALPSTIARHQRATALPMIASIRDQLQLCLPLGVELQLARYAERASENSVDRLNDATQLLEEVCRRRPAVPTLDSAHPIALIVLGPARG
jgi:superfamily II DNA or RNA helicase